MQYVALIFGKEGRWNELSAEERDGERGEYMAPSQESATAGGHDRST